ncbi:hypothetical protein AC578_9922 [Pseudocercospora eumusae]|uniref:Casein kinase substrate phosphoprotein PP28 domain-containing protein n=1 Tax=Pseudocercospora eumusae TaxID=321146 RepID=A0A139HB64_9PEZI|nr:hypothetical protein AC578_9922 [Pseudocercospora eumusae]
MLHDTGVAERARQSAVFAASVIYLRLDSEVCTIPPYHHIMSSKAVAAGLGKLKISDSKPTSKKAEPAESWEDEADLSSDAETEKATTPGRPGTADYPPPPPPTPSSPVNARHRPTVEKSFGPLQFDGALDSVAESSLGYQGEEKRPEKTTAVASRLIAAGIGQKAPKRTKEQREYDQAMKVQEKQKRDQARAEEDRKRREAEQAKKAIWDD